MRRREFLSLLGGAAIIRSSSAQSQPADRVRVVGILMSPANDSRSQANFVQFKSALRELGWTEGRNLSFEVRWGSGDIDRILTFANDLVKVAPDVILAIGTPAVAALKQATSSIPVVFVIVNDPVAQGFVSSVARPGGNITGFSYMDYTVLDKSLQLLKQMAPSMSRVGFLFNPETYPYYEVYLSSTGERRQELGLDLVPLRVRSETDIKQAFEGLAGGPGSGLMAPPDPFTSAHRRLIVELAIQYRLPATYGLRAFVAEGGMMFYAPDISDIFPRSAAYIDRILKGSEPGGLPVQAPTKTEFVINLKTMQTLGITVPPNVLAIADEVIE